VRIVSRPQNLIGPDQRMSMIAIDTGLDTGIPLLDRYSTCRRRRQDRSSFHQNTLYMVISEYEHLVVRVPFLLL
jgi:hypothetical protein